MGISDVYGALYKPDGINVKAAMHYAANHKKLLKGYHEDGIKVTTNGELLELNVDVLTPAALENQINENNMNDIRAKIIAEAANGPTTKPADEVLENKGVIVVPDILANAGGVVVSYSYLLTFNCILYTKYKTTIV